KTNVTAIASNCLTPASVAGHDGDHKQMGPALGGPSPGGARCGRHVGPARYWEPSWMKGWGHVPGSDGGGVGGCVPARCDGAERRGVDRLRCSAEWSGPAGYG